MRPSNSKCIAWLRSSTARNAPCFSRVTVYAWRMPRRNLNGSGGCFEFLLWRHGVQPIWSRAMIPSMLADPVRSRRAGQTSPSKTQIFFLLFVRLDFAITGYAPQNLARGAHKAVVDIDKAELKKLDPHLQQPIHADAKRFLEDFLSQKNSIRLSDHSAWDARCAGWKTRYPVVTEEHRKPEGPVSVFHLAEVIGTEVKPEDRLVVGNSGSAIEIYLLAFPTLHSQRLFHTAGLGAMG